MLIAQIRQTETAPYPAGVFATPDGEKTPDEAPKPKEDKDDKPERDTPEPDLDEELEESFPASDPPASTQP